MFGKKKPVEIPLPFSVEIHGHETANAILDQLIAKFKALNEEMEKAQKALNKITPGTG